jgi:hypothetical protein
MTAYLMDVADYLGVPLEELTATSARRRGRFVGPDHYLFVSGMSAGTFYSRFKEVQRMLVVARRWANAA